MGDASRAFAEAVAEAMARVVQDRNPNAMPMTRGGEFGAG